MIKRVLLLIAILSMAKVAFAEISANFTAQECSKEVYRNGFDTDADFSQWTLSKTNNSATWHLAAKARITGIPEFSSINPKSVNSLAVWYDDAAFGAQDESLTSPKMEIPAGSQASFYACFDGVYVLYADLKLIATDESGNAITIFSAFDWSQSSGHERSKWLPFTVDLSALAGKKVTFSFSYKGRGGDDVMVDDFVVSQPDTSDDAKASIFEGEEIHFVDASTGGANKWIWEFEGANVATSEEQNPVVKYSQAGTYKVKLTVSDGTNSSSKEKEGFVVVKGQAPMAAIGLPSEGYLSPWVGIFIPKNTNVTFRDQSKGNPSSWAWQLPNSSSPTSSEQNPTVSYATEGVYSVGMRATNSVGTDATQFDNAIQVGGKQNIWNIELSENQDLAPITLGFYGNYGGSNWLDIPGFGEYFSKPLAKGEISAVDIFFAKTTTVSPESILTVSVMSSKDGLPDKVLASGTVKMKDLKYEENNYLPTTIAFAAPATVDEEYFISVIGFPNESNASGTDDIAMYCSPKRADGGKSTVYNYMAMLDDKYQPTGEFEWVKNSDEFLSFAISPVFEYKDANGVECIPSLKNELKLVVSGDNLKVLGASDQSTIEIYNISGQLVATANTNEVSVCNLDKGIYIIKVVSEGAQFVSKIKL